MTLYETKDFPLAAFLVTSGIPLQAHSRDGNVSTFMFSDSQKLQDLVHEYYSFSATVNPVSYSNAFRNLKCIMYTTVTTNDNTNHNFRSAQ